MCAKPYFSIGNDELERAPILDKSKLLNCKGCGHPVTIQDAGKDNILSFTSCKHCGQDYLVGVNGKKV